MIKRAVAADAGEIAAMAVQMWNEHSLHELTDEFSVGILQGRAHFFVKYEQGIPVGFAECGLRHDYVEGTETSPVGYLEGVFVKEPYRHRGYAKELLSACETWSKEQGCTEFASDCELDNDSSFRFHMATGFEEANRIICFTKKL